MALLVTDQGEIDSLRTLLNATHEIPRNLVLKLYTGPSTAPSEQDVPSATKYFEPYNATNNSGYGSAPTTGYPLVINNRTEENQDEHPISNHHRMRDRRRCPGLRRRFVRREQQ